MLRTVENPLKQLGLRSHPRSLSNWVCRRFSADLMKLRVGFLGFRVQSGNGVGDLASVLVAVGMPGGRNACARFMHSALFYLEVPHSQHLHMYICVYIYIYDYIYIHTHMAVSANGRTPILAQIYQNSCYGTPYRDPSFSVSRNSYETLPNPVIPMKHYLIPASISCSMLFSI